MQENAVVMLGLRSFFSLVTYMRFLSYLELVLSLPDGQNLVNNFTLHVAATLVTACYGEISSVVKRNNFTSFKLKKVELHYKGDLGCVRIEEVE